MKIDYEEYINSEQWRTKRKWVLDNPYFGRANECFICKSTKKLHVHHMDYSRLGHELEDDLVILCLSCHNKVHMGKDGQHQNTDIKMRVFFLKFDNDRYGSDFLPKKDRFKKKKKKFYKTKVKKYKPIDPNLTKDQIITMAERGKISKMGTLAYYNWKKQLSERQLKSYEKKLLLKTLGTTGYLDLIRKHANENLVNDAKDALL